MNIDELITPCYIILEEDYKKNIVEFKRAFNNRWGSNVIFGYSIKTNHLPYLIKIAKQYNWYAEAVSSDEYYFAKRAGFNDSNIIINGPFKNMDILPLLNEDAIINLDHLIEVKSLCENYKKVQKNAKIGLRVNFNLESKCPGETTAGKEVNRFGICYENGDLKKAIDLLNENHIQLAGLHFHSSSSSRSTRVYHAICETIKKIMKQYDLKDLQFIDIGGGFFGGTYFPNKPSYDDYAKVICETLMEVLNPLKTTLILEPGAAVLATACDYLVSVTNIRDVRGTKVITVDGTCTHINPFLKPNQVTPCSIFHFGNKTNDSQVIGGSSCMEMDRFYPLGLENELKMETKLLFHCAGAYTMTHNSSFIQVPPIIYTYNNKKFSIIRQRNEKLMDI